MAVLLLGLERDGSVDPQDRGAAPAGPTSAAEIEVPAAFQGEWNMNVAHCGSGVNESRLTIAANRIAFYESAGPITAVTVHAPDDITISARLTGEGESSVRARRFRLSDDQSELADVTDGAAAMIRYRCPMRG